ncbi:MAG: RND family transporter, partial [Calditrichota bacterium]
MQFIRNIVHRFPKTIIIVTLLITGFLGYHAFDISINTDLEHMFPENDPAVQTFDRISNEYGGSEFMVFVLEAPDVLSMSSLRQIDSLTTSFSQITGVSKVRSITNIEEIRGEDFTIQVGQLIPS